MEGNAFNGMGLQHPSANIDNRVAQTEANTPIAGQATPTPQAQGQDLWQTLYEIVLENEKRTALDETWTPTSEVS